MKTIRIEISLKTVVAAAVLLMVVVAPVAFATVAGTASRWSGNQLVFDGTSGNDAVKFDVDGLRLHLGTGTDDTIESNGTYLKVGPTVNGYVASGTPVPIANVYVNNTVASVTYGNSTMPANANTVTGISYGIRLGGSGGVDGGFADKNLFQVGNGGVNKCVCTFSCDEDAGAHFAACANDAGTGCVFAASAALDFSFTTLGSCTSPTDLLGNVIVWGKWQ